MKPSISTRKKGTLYEDYAVEYLLGNGYRILDRNVHSRFGEIDIVAEEGEVVVFVEVRMRSRQDFGSPAESVTQRKLDKIRAQSEFYLASHRLRQRNARIDVLSIYSPKGGPLQIEHLVNVSETR